MKEVYRDIFLRINDVQFLLDTIRFKLPEDRQVLEAYEALTIYVIENFEMPANSEKYVCENFDIKDKIVSSPATLVEEIKKNNRGIKNYFNIMLPIRNVGYYFRYGKPKDIELFTLIKLKYLIAKLHALIGDRYFNS